MSEGKVSLPVAGTKAGTSPDRPKRLAAALLGRRREDAQLRYLSKAVLLEESSGPRVLHTAALTTSVLVIAFLVWASQTKINEVTHAPGEVVPSGHEQIVQHLDGGLIKDIKVRSGDFVEKGQLLMALEDTSTREEFLKAEAKKLYLEMTAARLEAQSSESRIDFKARFPKAAASDIETQSAQYASWKTDLDARQKIVLDQINQKKKDLTILANQIATAEKNLVSVHKIYAARKKLYDSQLISYPTMAKTEQDRTTLEGEIQRLKEETKQTDYALNELSARLNAIRVAARLENSQKLTDTVAEIRQTDGTIDVLERKRQRLDLYAPVRGIVKALNVNTIGSVISPGQTIATIVPLDEELVVETQIAPSDIGQVRKDQQVHLKFSAFDFSRYGVVDGTIEDISAATYTSSTGSRYYRGRIRLAQPYVGHDSSKNPILPGMTVMADIQGGKRSLLDYLLKPVKMAVDTAFSER